MKRVLILTVLLMIFLNGCASVFENDKQSEYVLSKRKTISYGSANIITETMYRNDGQIAEVITYGLNDCENKTVIKFYYDDRGLLRSMEAVGENVINFYSMYSDGYYVCVPADEDFKKSFEYTYRENGKIYSIKEGNSIGTYDEKGNLIELKYYETYNQSPNEEQMATYNTYDNKGRIIKSEHFVNGSDELDSIDEYKYDSNDIYPYECVSTNNKGETTYKIMKKLDEHTLKFETVGNEKNFEISYLDSFGNCEKTLKYINGELHEEIINEWTEIY